MDEQNRSKSLLSSRGLLSIQPVGHKVVKCVENKAHFSRAYWPPKLSDEIFDRGEGGI